MRYEVELVTDYEHLLDIVLPKIVVSDGAAWHKRCPKAVEDHYISYLYNFEGVEPQFYETFTQYVAAKKLCYIVNEIHNPLPSKREQTIALCKEIVFAEKDNPMRYFDCTRGYFDYASAITCCSPWQAQFDNCFDLDDIFYELDCRSPREAAKAFLWCKQFFASVADREDSIYRECLTREFMWATTGSLDYILEIHPEIMSYLLEDEWGVSNWHLDKLSYVAASLYRHGHFEEGTKLYKRCFEKVWNSDVSMDTKMDVLEKFVKRLEDGYKHAHSVDIDPELHNLLISHLALYKNKKWLSHMRKYKIFG